MKNFTPLEYLKMDIASSYGLGKLNWEARLDWFHEHEPVLEGLLATAESPCLMHSGIQAYYLTLQGKPTTHLITLDATASCLQMIGILTKDVVTCTAANVISTGNREDPYTLINNKLMGLTGKSFPRKITKQMLMITCFGGTTEPKELYGEDYPAYLTAINQCFPSVMGYLATTLNAWNSRTSSHTWVMPDNHRVNLPVTNDVMFPIELYGERYDIPVKLVGTKKSSVSLAAHLAHATDAYIVREMVKRCNEQGFYILTIHDGFRCHPIHANTVRQTYNAVLSEIAGSQLLCDCLLQITGNKLYLPAPYPEWNSVILGADYSIC